jgi:Domain of unknown function (DUF4190)
MTTPGEPSDKPQGAEATPSPGSHEAPPIEQSRQEPGHPPPPPPGYPPSGYPPPSYPPPGYTPPPSYPPPAPGHGGPSYSSDPSAYPPPPPSYSSDPSAYPPPPPSYGGTPGYPGGYSGDYQQPGATNQLAMWSLVASLIGILCGIGSIVGIVLGVLALNQIKQTRQGGHGLAVAGIAVGVASLIISALWYVIAFSH